LAAHFEQVYDDAIMVMLPHVARQSVSQYEARYKTRAHAVRHGTYDYVPSAAQRKRFNKRKAQKQARKRKG
jgi:hypothetical protein